MNKQELETIKYFDNKEIIKKENIDQLNKHINTLSKKEQDLIRIHLTKLALLHSKLDYQDIQSNYYISIEENEGDIFKQAHYYCTLLEHSK